MNTATPETDAESFSTVCQGELVCADFARKLERERNDLKNAINGLCEHFQIQPASATLLAVKILRMQGKLNEARKDAIFWQSLAEGRGRVHDETCIEILADSSNEYPFLTDEEKREKKTP